MKTLLFIYNPAAGKAKITSALGEITAQFQQEDWLVTLYATRAAGDATRMVQEMGGQYDRIVCSGGDGTLNEVVSGLVHGGLDVPLGYLPAGSTNDFSKTLRLPANLHKAAEIAVTGTPFACDMGQFNGERVFVYVAAFGVFTSVSYETPQEMKQILGHAAYVLRGIRSLGEITSYSMTIEHDGVIEEGNYIYGMVSNSVSVGGFQGMKTNEVILDDGKFEVLLVRTPTSLAELNAVLAAPDQQGPQQKRPLLPGPSGQLPLQRGGGLDAGRRVRWGAHRHNCGNPAPGSAYDSRRNAVMTDTIAAIATGSRRTAIGILRISGPQARQCWSRPSPPSAKRPWGTARPRP